MGNAWARQQFKLENKIKKYSYACDCVALARKVNCILELNTTNLIPKHSITSSVRTFSLQPVLLKARGALKRKGLLEPRRKAQVRT